MRPTLSGFCAKIKRNLRKWAPIPLAGGDAVKIQGPGGAGKPPATEGIEKTEQTGTGFVDKLAEKPAAEVAGAGGAGPGDGIAALAKQLESGAITPRQAMDRLVEMSTQGVL